MTGRVVKALAMKYFGPFRIDIVNQCLWRGETQVSLRPKAFSVLAYLLQHSGRLITHHELLQALWPNTFVQPEVLKSPVAEVRVALRDSPRRPSFIETLPRRGYRFIRDVSEMCQDAISNPRIIGRQQRLAKLHACLGRASSRERQIVFITGEAGIGKTTLGEAFAQDAREHVSGIRIARGPCVEGYGVQEPYY